MKAEGVRKGVPDLFIPEWMTWIEMKREEGGTLSSDQEKMIEYLERIGYECYVCRGADSAMRISTNISRGKGVAPNVQKENRQGNFSDSVRSFGNPCRKEGKRKDNQ